MQLNRRTFIGTLAASAVCSTAGFALANEAETADFSGMTIDELYDLRASVDEEIAARPEGASFTLPVGQYLVGTDIWQGEYTLEFVADEEDDEYSSWYVYENQNMYLYDVDRLWLGDFPKNEGTVRANSPSKIRLYNGDYFIVYRSSIACKKTASIKSNNEEYVVPEGTLVPVGVYAIGADIPAGTFNVCFDGNYSSRFRAYDADQDWDNSFTDPRVEILATRDNASSVIILKEGMVVKVEYNPVIMKKTGDGLVFD